LRRIKEKYMKYVKILGLAAMALAALMAMAGTASATSLTSSSGTTPTIKASSTNAVLTGPFGFGTISCANSTVEGTVTEHGTNITAGGAITSLTFTNCEGGEPTSPVVKPGSLQVHGTSTTGNGTVTSSSASVIVHKTLLGTCTFNTASTGTDIGTLTGSNITKGNAKLDIAATIPGTCGSGAWEGNYTVTSPASLEVH
jgi:hypothetical protein